MADRSIVNTDVCNVCKTKDNLKRCGRCKSIYYCGREHQKHDWLYHKAVCVNKTETFRTRSRSNTNTKNKDAKLFEVIQQNTNLIKQEKTANIYNQAEIDSILDFSSVVANGENSICSDNQKDIFNEFMQSDKTFTGPADETEHQETKLHSSTDSHDLSVLQTLEADKDLVLFDTGPFIEPTFNRPSSFQHKELAQFICSELIGSGYCVVDGLFDNELIDGMLSEAQGLNYKTGELGGGRSSGDDTKKVVNTNIRSDKIKWIEGNEKELPNAMKVLNTMDSITSFFSFHLENCFIQGRTKGMVACYPGNGGYYRRHVDNPSMDGRRITCILYLNKEWNVLTDGGLLRIFPSNHTQSVDIAPLANRLLFFWSDKRNPHEVQPCYRDRYAMTVWYFDVQERENAKIEELKQETERINVLITELEEKKKKLDQLTQNQMIENRAMEAVKSLAPQELEAISFLLEHHPNPSEALTSMGISDTIQQALRRYFSSLHSGV
ncbi:uncharacterized protein LOC131935563 [Physella acuta]|uniref:uncharacterized protein LOC131935563 n=1 Tax=Physella acuta TaxID=109671 RepID=UPI0027DC5CE3|nr:uncharacterized protein LOC131935563 [Physella acuta]